LLDSIRCAIAPSKNTSARNVEAKEIGGQGACLGVFTVPPFLRLAHLRPLGNVIAQGAKTIAKYRLK
jgi:hypothetical protein